jgi:tetratricopeptide (TPR) repeat protein
MLAVLLTTTYPSFAGDREAAKVLLSTAEKNYKDGDYPTAQSMAERAIATDKEFSKAHFVLAQCLESQNKAREAINEYAVAAECARKEKDSISETQATSAAKKLAPGLMDIKQTDQKYADKLSTLAYSAMNDGQLDTAKAAYQTVLALNPTNEEARKNLDDVQRRIEARGDPIKSKIAAAGMSEVYYQLGVGAKDEARKLAHEISHKFADTSFGKDAQHLLDCNFDLSKTIGADIAAAKQEIQQIRMAAVKAPAPVSTPGPNSKPAPVASSTSSQVAVDIDAVEKKATDDAKKMAKDKLVSTFGDTFKKGKEFYSKATPGSEGNQKNVASALEQFICCEALYLRIDEEKMITADLEAQEKDASMLRYACMKMTILSH